MKILVVVLLFVAGIINLVPLVGVLSAEHLVRLYDVPLDNNDLVVLMRHRAVLFGLLGIFIIYSAFRTTVRFLACIAGLISMIAFIVIAYSTGDYGQALHKIVIADIIGSLALAVVLLITARDVSRCDVNRAAKTDKLVR